MTDGLTRGSRSTRPIEPPASPRRTPGGSLILERATHHDGRNVV